MSESVFTRLMYFGYGVVVGILLAVVGILLAYGITVVIDMTFQ